MPTLANEPVDILRANAVVSGYGNKPVVSGVSLSVARGEIVAVIGHNGSGKSTLLKTLFGLLPLWAGDVSLDGRPSIPEPRLLRAAGVGYAPQGGRVFSDLTVSENVRIAAMALSDVAERSRSIGSVQRLLPQLQPLMSRLGRELSGGERQAVALAMVLVVSPRLILLDEPSLGLAPQMVRYVLDQLQDIRQHQGTALLIVEQKIREVLRVADRVYVMRNGTVSFSGSAESLRDVSRLREVYL